MLRIGIIGSGFGLIGLMPAFRGIKGAKIVAICSRKVSPLPYKDTKIYSHWKTMLDKKILDAVVIAVPPHAQYKIAKSAIKKGINVFAEKPLAANLKEARELFVLAKREGIVHGMDFEFPEVAEWKKVKKLLDRNAYGKLNHVSVNWDWMSGHLLNRRKNWKTNVAQGGGVLAYYFSHGLNYLEHFAGEITDAKSAFTYSPLSLGGGEVGVDLLLKFKNATGSAHVSCNSPGLIRHQLIFYCERGVVVLENRNSIVDNFQIRTYTNSGQSHVKVRKDKGRRGEDERAKIVRILADRFVKACAGKGKMYPTFAEGLRTHELIEKIRTNTNRIK
ncbi:MAG TPA: Gfo/Idh/MocA family oxidoreductase [Candidatus Paceibacterota bacterium]